jgi:hypothetical protein
MVYEHTESGNYLNWENANSYITDNEYEKYIYAYDCRTGPLLETALEKRMGCRNPEHRRLVLQILDMKYEERRFPWQHKRPQEQQIKTPEDALAALTACMQFVLSERERNPEYRPPDEFLGLMVRLQPFFQQLQAAVSSSETNI